MRKREGVEKRVALNSEKAPGVDVYVLGIRGNPWEGRPGGGKRVGNLDDFARFFPSFCVGHKVGIASHFR